MIHNKCICWSQTPISNWLTIWNYSIKPFELSFSQVWFQASIMLCFCVANRSSHLRFTGCVREIQALLEVKAFVLGMSIVFPCKNQSDAEEFQHCISADYALTLPGKTIDMRHPWSAQASSRYMSQAQHVWHERWKARLAKNFRTMTNPMWLKSQFPLALLHQHCHQIHCRYHQCQRPCHQACPLRYHHLRCRYIATSAAMEVHGESSLLLLLGGSSVFPCFDSLYMILQ